MKHDGPLIILEKDPKERKRISDVFNELDYPNELIFFEDGESALEFLNKTDVIPFIIISNINLPKLDGFALRDKLQQEQGLQEKCIPFVFISGVPDRKLIIDAYAHSAQGIFLKRALSKELKESFIAIMEYWKRCVSPNTLR